MVKGMESSNVHFDHREQYFCDFLTGLEETTPDFLNTASEKAMTKSSNFDTLLVILSVCVSNLSCILPTRYLTKSIIVRHSVWSHLIIIQTG